VTVAAALLFSAALTVPTVPSRDVTPHETWSSARDARGVTKDATHVWIATGGGLDRYDQRTRELRHFGAEDGLDSLDVRSVDIAHDEVVVRTAFSRCTSTNGGRFRCEASRAASAQPANLEVFQGHAVVGKERVGDDVYVATRGGGAFFLPGGDSEKPLALGDASSALLSFVHTGAVFGGALWLGTFRTGLVQIALDSNGRPAGPLSTTARAVTSPTRLVNRLVAVTGKHAALYVGASEGLFVTRDGVRFNPVEAIAPRAITGLAATREHLWVTTAEALYRLPVSGVGPVQRALVRPSGTHAIQAVAVDDKGTAWLATEDRGIVRVDDDGTVRAYDRLAGLPSSWFVAVDTDGEGGAIATSLRHGSVHITRDGSWAPLAWAPGPWGLTVHRDAQRTCIGTQGGAACETRDGIRESFVDLPDPRVHVILPLGGATLVATEAGVAMY
jgi:ligand-binding sensor domain-containing protein